MIIQAFNIIAYDAVSGVTSQWWVSSRLYTAKEYLRVLWQLKGTGTETDSTSDSDGLAAPCNVQRRSVDPLRDAGAEPSLLRVFKRKRAVLRSAYSVPRTSKYPG